MLTITNQSLDLNQLDPCLRGDDNRFAVALSGGADSMALTLLAQEWTQKHGGKIIALTVDHGLRLESANEAKQVHEWCVAHGIKHHTLHAQLREKTQAAAREARYRLLTDWCKAHGVRHLLTAHHRDDQVETLIFRLARGSGLDGLACIAPVSKMHGILLLRPLLAVPKSQLEAILSTRGEAWLQDSSNASPCYTRNRIRRQLQQNRDYDALATRAYDLTQSFARIRNLLETNTAIYLTECFSRATFLLHGPAFRALPPEYGMRVLERLITELNGEPHPPRSKKLDRLYRDLLAGKAKRRTLGGLLFTRRKESWHVRREHDTIP